MQTTYPTMTAAIAADQIRDWRADAARDQRARLARRGRRAGNRTAATWHRPHRAAGRAA